MYKLKTKFKTKNKKLRAPMNNNLKTHNFNFIYLKILNKTRNLVCQYFDKTLLGGVYFI